MENSGFLEPHRICEYCGAPLSDESARRYPASDTGYCQVCTALASTILHSAWFTRVYLEWLRKKQFSK